MIDKPPLGSPGHQSERAVLPGSLVVRWKRARKNRATSVATFMPNRLALEALVEIESMIDAIETATATLDDPTVSQFFGRIHSYFADALDGVFERRPSRLMDAARDLIEVAVLLRDFRHEPQRFDKWKRVTEEDRPQEFGFNKLLRKYPADPLTWIGENPDETLQEYIYHSRTVHPAFPLTEDLELSRGFEPDDASFIQLAFDAVEVIRHTMCALAQAVQWLGQVAPNLELGDEPSPFDDDSATRRRVERHFEWLAANKTEQFTAAFEEMYGNCAPRRRRSST